MPKPYMDFMRSSLNPCSLETIPTPVILSNRERCWPTMISCYQLEDDGTRSGHMELFAVKVPDIVESNESSLPLSFGRPYPVLQDEVSGILDGKWARASDDETAFYFATAHATGEIQIHMIQINPDPMSCTEKPFLSRRIGKSDPPTHGANEQVSPLCLSLSWDSFIFGPYSESSRIIATYSNGHVSIFDVLFTDQAAEIVCADSFLAHKLFSTPAEVWSADFLSSNLVMSGGDDGTLKTWDVRSFSRPTATLKPFQAGATCISKHPTVDNVVACGSYDETVCLYDIRNTVKPIVHTKELGGGIWRIKFHPYSHDRILVGAMHGGCRVLRVYGDLEEEHVYSEKASVRVKKEFVEHESMAYGADWLVCRHPTQNGYFEAAGSCSFYDRAVYLWDSIM